MTQKYSALLASALIASGLMTPPIARLSAQDIAVIRPDLSGRWQLNRDLSENAEEKLKSMGDDGGHAGGWLGRIFAGGWEKRHAQFEAVIVNAPSSFVLAQEDQRVVLTEPDGHVRTLPTNNQAVKVDGRDVQTVWKNNRLVSEITVGDAKVTETYERLPGVPQLIVMARMEMRRRQVSVRRVYDAVTTPENLTPASARIKP